MADEIARLKVVIDAEDNASAVVDRISGKVGSVSGVSAQTVRGLKGATKEVQTAADKWIGAGKAINSFGKDLDTITKPMQVAAVGAIAGGVAVSKMAMDYESAFIKVKKTVDGTPEQLAKLDAEIKALSDDIPVSSTELAELAAVGGQLGIAVDDVAKFTEVMAAIGTATNLQGEDGAATIARFMNVMGEETKNVDRVGSAIVELGNNTATTEAEIATMAQRMGKFGETVGMNTDQVLGYSAALSSVGIEAQLGGSAIGRTWLNIESAVNSGGKELATYAKYAGVSASEFKKQWNDSPSGAFNGLIKGLSSVENLTGALAELGVENIQDQQIVMALANNYDLMAKSLDLSANAYKDNTALMKEAETAYGSVANQLKLAKNDIQDAAISWGNVLLPEIRDGAQWVGNVAKSFENMSDAQKKTVVSGAKAAVALGLTTKVATSTLKGVGNTVEAIGNIKKATAAGGALAKFAPALAKAGAAAGPVAWGIAGITAAVVVGKLAYDKYYDSVHNFGDELKEQADKTKESYSSYKELNDLAWEFKDLNGKIELGKIEGAELESAQSRLEEIKKILSEKYNIDLDSGDIDTAIEKALQLQRLNYLNQKSELRTTISSTQDEYDEAVDNLPELRGQRTEAQQNADMYVQARLTMAEANDQYKASVISATEYEEIFLDVMTQVMGSESEANRILSQMKSESPDTYQEGFKTMSNYYLGLEEGKNNNLLKNLDKEIQEYEASVQKMKEAKQTLAQALMYDVEETFKNGGDATAYLKEIGQLAKEGFIDGEAFATQAALIQSGFKDIQSAASAEGGLDKVSQQATKLAQEWGQIPETKSIKINAEGDISVIDDATKKVEEISNDTVTVSVTAKGNIAVLDSAKTQVKEIVGNLGDVDIQVNAEGDIEIIDETKQKLGEIDGKTGTVTLTAEGDAAQKANEVAENVNQIEDKSVKITPNITDFVVPELQGVANYTLGESPVTVPNVTGIADFDSGEVPETVSNAKGKADFDVGTSPETVPDASGKVNYSGVFPTEAPTLTGKVVYSPEFTQQAKGTQNFGGGLAMVNDQTGISDPRELIIDKGRAFIPQGRNVILPLSRGAKVYTAAQTKRMMAALGIPQYASGKDNSDAFTSARDNWTHTTNIRAVSVSEELKKWVEFSDKFKSNINDANDIQEEIYSASMKLRDELNEDSEDYILTHARMNNWSAYGDTAVDAFNRVRDRERQYVAEGKVLQRDSHKFLEELGSDMFDARVSNSQWWLEHETEYNNLSVEDYMAGLDRMQAYTDEYYAEGIIDAEKYYETTQKISDMRVDKSRDEFRNRLDNSQWWLDHETEYNNLSVEGYMDGLDRMRAYTEEYYQNNIISAEEYYSTLQMLSDMQVDKTREQNDKEYEAWKKSADGYYEQRMLYEDWDEFGDSPEQFFERRIERQNEFLKQDKISWEEYNEAVIGYEMDLYRAQQDEFDSLLDSYDKYIGKVNDKYDELIAKKREAHDTKNLKKDLEDANAEAAKYAGAVTQKGKDVYNQAVKDIEEIKFEMEMNELEKKQTQVIASLEKNYASFEKDKKKILAAINVSGVDLAGYTSLISADGSNIKDVLSQIYGVVKKLQPINQTRYGDTTLNINAGGANIEGMIRYATNAIAG